MRDSWVIRTEGATRMVETSIAGRIKRICYPQFAPAYGLLLIQDGLKRKALSLAEAADLEEGVRDVARLDGFDYQLLPTYDKPSQPLSFGARLLRFLTGIRDEEELERQDGITK